MDNQTIITMMLLALAAVTIYSLREILSNILGIIVVGALVVVCILVGLLWGGVLITLGVPIAIVVLLGWLFKKFWDWGRAKADRALEINEVHNSIKTLLDNDKWVQVEDFMQSLKPICLVKTDLLLAILEATYPAKSNLPYRAVFFTKVQRIMESRGDEGTLYLLEGLE